MIIYQFLGALVLIGLGLAAIFTARRHPGPEQQGKIRTGSGQILLGVVWLVWAWLLFTGRVS